MAENDDGFHRGEKVRSGDPGQDEFLQGRLAAYDGGSQGDTLLRGLAERLGDKTSSTRRKRGKPPGTPAPAPPVGLEGLLIF